MIWHRTQDRTGEQTMFPMKTTPWQHEQRPLLPALAVAALLTVPAMGANGQQARLETLRIGASGTLTGNADDPREKAGLKTLRRFIKDETGMDSDITGQMNWQTIADKLSKGELH